MQSGIDLSNASMSEHDTSRQDSERTNPPNITGMKKNAFEDTTQDDMLKELKDNEDSLKTKDASKSAQLSGLQIGPSNDPFNAENAPALTDHSDGINEKVFNPYLARVSASKNAMLPDHLTVDAKKVAPKPSANQQDLEANRQSQLQKP